eukprot:jgi/Ulvmu1/4635/UM002_0366.1
MVPVPTGVLIGGGMCVALYSAYSLFWWVEGERCEKPKYEVTEVLLRSSQQFRLRAFNEIELRQYSPYIVAEATITGTMRKARGTGFMTVARYIFGENVKRGEEGSDLNEKVSMTSPVRMEMPEDASSKKVSMTSPVRMEMDDSRGSEAAEHTYKVSFVMPSEYTMDTLPVPKNSNVEIKEVPGHSVAALTFFGGSPSRERVKKEAEKLKSYVEEAGKQVDGDVMLYQYHPPFAPSFLRKVEVLYRLKE